MLISKNHLRARHAVSKDESRPLLCAINISKNEDTVVAASTDGYILIEVREETPDAGDFPTTDTESSVEAVRINGATAAKMKTALKPNKLLPALNYAHVTDSGIIVTDLEHTTIFKDAQVEGNFPAYEKLMPDTEAAVRVVKLDPALLAKVLKAFDGLNAVTLEVHDGPLAPLVLRADEYDYEVTGVVMPLKS